MKTGYKIIINGVYIYHRAIESVRYDDDEMAIIIRTVSGDEHALECDSKYKVEPFIEKLDARAELMDSL